jgi:hypothetical protein
VWQINNYLLINKLNIIKVGRSVNIKMSAPPVPEIATAKNDKLNTDLTNQTMQA